LLFAVFVVRATGINLGRLAVAGIVIGLGLIAYEVNNCAAVSNRCTRVCY
jgi:hypothetical protein